MVEKHDLLHEFPEHRERIHTLKLENNYFLRLFDEYHEVDREVRRIEAEVEVSSDFYLEDKKKERLLLKDRLYKIITASA
ncbi:MAG: DUF465 domain-containing protein [Deltaproteobacteria bacterium]|nr:DUF465 domain-containing protein [Deltaproteobacteria bacterium]